MDYRDNRMKEYRHMLREIEEAVPAELEGVFERAAAREKKHRRAMKVIKPLASMAAVFVCFVLSVNFITPVAQACSKIPVLKELAAAVDFSGSLSRAVENDYVQPIGLSETKNGIRAYIDYVIVDQKQLNIFYRLEYENEADSKVDEGLQLAALAELGEDMPPHSVIWANPDEEEGKLRSVTVDFTDSHVPETILLLLTAKERDTTTWEYSKDDLAVFNFTLEIDPYFTAQGRSLDINEDIEIEGQKFILTQVEIYPTHLQIDVESDEGNTMWLKSLDFYVEATGKDGDSMLETVNGISALGNSDNPEMRAFRKGSPWFYETESLKIVITGARLAEKNAEGITMKLTEPEAGVVSGRLPEGVRFEGVSEELSENGKPAVYVSFRAIQPGEGGSISEIFQREYLDGAGNEGYMETYTLSTGDDSGFTNTLVLEEYDYDTVTFYPYFTNIWIAKQPVEIAVIS